MAAGRITQAGVPGVVR